MQQLIDELKKPQYQGLSDKAAADLLNALTVQKRRLVPTAEVKQYATIQGFYSEIVIDSQSAIDRNRRKLCLNVWLWVDDPAGKIEHVDMDEPASKQMIAGLLAFGYINEAQAIALDGLANQTVRWVDHVGLGGVCDGAVHKARQMILEEQHA